MPGLLPRRQAAATLALLAVVLRRAGPRHPPAAPRRLTPMSLPTSPIPIVDELRAIADDPTVSPDRRRAARGALRQIEQACAVAKLWGGDEAAELRVGIY